MRSFRFQSILSSFLLTFMLQVARMINVSSHAEIKEGIAELQAAQVLIYKYILKNVVARYLLQATEVLQNFQTFL